MPRRRRRLVVLENFGRRLFDMPALDPRRHRVVQVNAFESILVADSATAVVTPAHLVGSAHATSGASGRITVGGISSSEAFGQATQVIREVAEALATPVPPPSQPPMSEAAKLGLVLGTSGAGAFVSQAVAQGRGYSFIGFAIGAAWGLRYVRDR